MSKGYYPILLDVESRPVVVIGGGEVAARKVQGLLNVGANVTVVSPNLTEELHQKAAIGDIRWQQRVYQAGDLLGAWIAVAATDDSVVNEAVAAEASRGNVPLNVVDQPRLCTFIAPSVIQRGDLTIAISTGGASPSAARYIREDLERNVADQYGVLVEVVSAVRKELQDAGIVAPAELWRQAVSPEVLRLIRGRDLAEAKDRLFKILRPRTEAA